jgi:hypothetical protein
VAADACIIRPQSAQVERRIERRLANSSIVFEHRQQQPFSLDALEHFQRAEIRVDNV